MKAYKLLINNNNNVIKIGLNNISVINNNELKGSKALTILSDKTSITNSEKEIFIPIRNYTIKFLFKSSGNYNNDFTSLFSDSEYIKNTYKKSQFLLEYLDSDNLEVANRYSRVLLSVIYDLNNNRGISENKKPIYSIDNSGKENYNIYYGENIEDYKSLYVRAYFLNAKDGKVYNFVNKSNLKIQTLTDSSYLYELRIFKNGTYSYYLNNNPVTDVSFYEINL